MADKDFKVKNGIEVGGNAVISGNLTVSGTTTTINTETVTVNDNIIVLNNNATGTPSENAGIEVERGDSTNASILWDESTDTWKAGLVGSESEIINTSSTGQTKTGDFTSSGNLTGSVLVSSQSLTNEGGQIELSLPSSGSTLSGTNVTIDIYQNRLRFFESGGTARGYYIDISGGGAGAGTSLTGGSSYTAPTLAGTTLSSGGTIDTLSGTLTADKFIASSNNLGTNFRVGDDAWIGDINLGNTIRITGIQDATQGYLVFGNGDGTALGRTGTGHLTYGGNTVWHAGNDGTGSGLDADTLDGSHASAFQPVDADLTAIAALAGTSGILKKTAADTWALITDNSTNWDSAYTDRLKWDGGSTGLTASTGRTSLGATTVGSNLFTLTNPSAITFLRVNADNTVSALDAATFRTAIGAGTSSTTGTVTSIATSTGLTGGTITTTGTLSIDTAVVPQLSAGNAFTGANTFTNGSGITVRNAATQDGIIIDGRAGGTTSLAVTLVPTTLTASRTLTLPDVTGTVVTTGDTGSVTNAMLAGSIANAKLTNSSITVNGTAISLGASGTITSNTTNTLTIGTGLSGTSFNGSSAVTIAIDSTVATLTGSQTLTNKTLTAPIIGGAGATFNGSTSGTTVLKAAAAAGTTTITMPATTGTMALTSDIPTVNDGALAVSIGTAGLTNTTVTWGTSSGFTANEPAGTVTYDLKVGPALTALAAAMTGTTGNGQVLSKSAADTFTFVTALTNPMTTLGDMIYGAASGAVTRLANAGTTNGTYVLQQVVSANAAAAPAWTLASGLSVSSAATLTTARNINGVSFNGSADITVTAAAGTLSGTALNSTVVSSSLTSVGTLTGLTVTGSGTNAISLTTGTTGTLTLDSGSTGAINIGTNANAKTVTIGNVTGATAVDINTGTGGFAVQTTGAGTVDIDTTNTATHTINIGTGATISGATKTVNIATTSVSGSTTTIAIGSNNAGSTTTLYGGTVNVISTLKVDTIDNQSGSTITLGSAAGGLIFSPTTYTHISTGYLTNTTGVTNWQSTSKVRMQTATSATTGGVSFESYGNANSTRYHMTFSNLNSGGTAGQVVGSISTSGLATSYTTSSDYRLKENVVPMSGSIDRLMLLKPSRFNFIDNPEITVDGFLAHEAQAIVPESVVGEKDAVDDQGKPLYQGIDQAKLVPLLTAALQDAVKEIEYLKAENESLSNDLSAIIARLDSAGI